MKTSKNQHGITISKSVYNYLNDNFWMFTKSTTKKVKVVELNPYFVDVIYPTKKQRDFEMNDIASKIAACANDLSGQYCHLNTVTY